MVLRVVKARDLQRVGGDGFTVLADEEVALASKGDSNLPIPLRRVRLLRDNGKTLSLLTNDMTRSAVAIAARYKARWQIELLFRWIKQHLKICKFLGHNENAIKLQICNRRRDRPYRFSQARRQNRSKVAHPILRFTDLVRKFLFEFAAISPPSKSPHPSTRAGNKTKARPIS